MGRLLTFSDALGQKGIACSYNREKWEIWLSPWHKLDVLCVCACMCLWRDQGCACVCVHHECTSLPVCGNELHEKSRGGKKAAELWPRVFNNEMKSSSRSAEVIIDCSLAKIQLQVMQLTSDPVTPVKNEPMHRFNAKCAYNRINLCAEANMRCRYSVRLCIIKPLIYVQSGQTKFEVYSVQEYNLNACV